MPLVPYQPLPSGSTTAEVIARELALLLGPGYQPSDGTLIAEDLRAMGTLLATLYGDIAHFLDELFGPTTIDLLSEWETRLGITTEPGQTSTNRQAAITAQRRATGVDTAQALLSAVQAVDPTATLYTNSATTAHTVSVSRAPFVYAIVIAATVYDNSYLHGQLQRILDQTKPAHTQANLVTARGFYCDDNASLTDRVALDA